MHNATDRNACEQSIAIVGGVHFIKDVNCESTIQAVRQAVQDHVEFCVHSGDFGAPNETEGNKPISVGNEASFQCMSAGSSGEPKRIRRTHLSWIKSFRVTAKNARIDTTDSYAIVGSLSHSLALYATLEAAWVGADIHALADARPDRQLSAIGKLRSSVLYATPTQLRQLCHHTIQPMLSLKHIFCGGGKLDQPTRSKLSSQFPNATVKEFYGASETSFITISDETTPVASVGKGYPGVCIEIRPVNGQLNTNEQLPINESGEIWVKSPYVFEKYCNADQNDTRWHEHYLCIGELGYFDKDNNLYLTGRRSRIINVADKLVYPEQAESILNENGLVRQCAVIGVPDSKRGSILIAIVEANDNAQLRSQLLKSCRQQLGALRSPRKIEFVDHLPMLLSGKPDLQRIEQQYINTFTHE